VNEIIEIIELIKNVLRLWTSVIITHVSLAFLKHTCNTLCLLFLFGPHIIYKANKNMYKKKKMENK